MCMGLSRARQVLSHRCRAAMAMSLGIAVTLIELPLHANCRRSRRPTGLASKVTRTARFFSSRETSRACSWGRPSRSKQPPRKRGASIRRESRRPGPGRCACAYMARATSRGAARSKRRARTRQDDLTASISAHDHGPTAGGRSRAQRDPRLAWPCQSGDDHVTLRSRCEPRRRRSRHACLRRLQRHPRLPSDGAKTKA